MGPPGLFSGSKRPLAGTPADRLNKRYKRENLESMGEIPTPVASCISSGEFIDFRVMKTILVISLSLLVATGARAGDNGTYAFLRNDASPRAASLGGSFVTMTDDPGAIFYNPAALASLSATRVSVGFYKHLMDINAGFASYGTVIPDFGYVGAGIQYINYGTFERRGPEGQDLGTFGAGELALLGGYAGELPNGLHYGANLKLIYSSIAEVTSTAAALDLGAQYIAVPERVLLGIALLNLGTQFDPYGTTRESLPLDLIVGASIYPEHLPAVLQVNLHQLNERYDSFGDRIKAFSVGVEVSPAANVRFRAGYDNSKRQELKIGSSAGFAGLSVGGGISAGMYTIDYAYSAMGEIGGLHRISVTF